MKSLTVLGASFLVLLAACTVKSKSSPIDAEPDTNPPASNGRTPGTGTEITTDEGEKLDIPTASPDEGTRPEDRPTGNPGGKVRTCDAPLTTAKALRRSRIYTKTNAVKLGAAVIDGKVSATTSWASGTVKPPASATLTTAASSGADLEGLDTLLGWDDADAPYDLMSTHIGPKNPLQIWADALTATSRRMTYTFASSSTQQDYRFSPEKRTADAPTGGDDRYVQSLAASKGVGVSLGITMASDCATGALADLLGKRPIVRTGPKDTAGTVLDAAKRTAIQELLVRDGAEVMIAAVTTRPDATIDKLVSGTTCSPTDLAACEKTLDDLLAAAATFMATKGSPTYETLSTGTDPNWAFMTFGPGDVKTLP